MKRKIALFLVFTMVLVNVFSIASSADSASTYNNNTFITNTDFVISDTGMAMVAYEYTGYPGITNSAAIEIVIQKRSLFFFWNDVVSRTFFPSGDMYTDVFYYQLSSKGTYKCTVTYKVYGSAGPADIIPFERTVTYS